LRRRQHPPLPTFRGGLLAEVSNALQERMEGNSSIVPPEHFSLEVKRRGCVHLPSVLQESLYFQSGDRLSVQRNSVSIRLDPYRDILEDLRRSVRESDRWRCLGPFLQRPLTSVGPDGSVAISPDLLELMPGDRVVLEVSTEGPRRALYLYRADA
jgi:hypothetical protein